MSSTALANLAFCSDYGWSGDSRPFTSLQLQSQHWSQFITLTVRKVQLYCSQPCSLFQIVCVLVVLNMVWLCRKTICNAVIDFKPLPFIPSYKCLNRLKLILLLQALWHHVDQYTSYLLYSKTSFVSYAL